MRYPSAAVVIPLLAACVQAAQLPVPAGPPPVPVELTAAERAAVEAGVRGELRDPESARFGPMSGTVDRNGGVAVCGSVDFKNSNGDPTGELPFIGGLTGSTFVPTLIGGDLATQDAVRLICQGKGPPGA